MTRNKLFVEYYPSLDDFLENHVLSYKVKQSISPVKWFLSSHRCRIDEQVTHKAWLNRSNILFTGTDRWSLDRRVTLLSSNNSDFSIHIEKVQITDEGPYTCTFQANNKPRIAHVYLIVQGQPLCWDRTALNKVNKAAYSSLWFEMISRTYLERVNLIAFAVWMKKYF